MPYKDKSKEKLWRENNRERVREKHRIWQIENKEKIKKHKHKYYLANREKMIKKQRQYFEENGVQQNIRRRAKKRNYQKDYVHNPDNQLKIKARRATQLIVVEGLCESCNENPATEKHHPDYDDPTKLQFLCGFCHRQIHGCGLIAVEVN